MYGVNDETVAQGVARWAIEQDIRHIFGVSGGRILPLINACSETAMLDFIHAKHECGAAFMADATVRFGRRKIGICATTSGPGATNLLTGVAASYADSIPVLVITGQAETGELGRGGIQEGSGIARSPDVRSMFAPITKASHRLGSGDDVGMYLSKLLDIATSGRPGPVHMDLPFDVLGHRGSSQSTSMEVVAPGAEPVKADLVEDFVSRFKSSRLPVIAIGQGLRNIPSELLVGLANSGIAITTTLGAKGMVPESHPSCLGMMGCYGQEVSARFLFEHADCIALVGTSLQYLSTTGWNSRFDASDVIHVDLDTLELEKARPSARQRVRANGVLLLQELLRAIKVGGLRWEEPQRVIRNLRANFGYYPAVYNQSSGLSKINGYIHPEQIFASISRLAADFPVVADSGENAYWMMLCCRSESPNFYANCFWGSMGYSIPAATAMALDQRRRVIAIVGDGGLLLSGTELHTAAANDAPITVLLLNNQSYGTQYHWQRDHFDNRTYATSIQNFEAAAFAKALGARYQMISDETALDSYLSDLENQKGVHLIELLIDPEIKPSQNSFSRLKK